MAENLERDSLKMESLDVLGCEVEHQSCSTLEEL